MVVETTNETWEKSGIKTVKYHHEEKNNCKTFKY